jgi:hypothetical protein
MIYFQQILRKNVVIFLVLASSLTLHGQIKGLIIEKDSKLPIAFASVIYQKQTQQKGVISDIQGMFEIMETDINSFTVSCVGYKQNKVTISDLTNSKTLIIELETYTQELNEVIVTPANNPALRIIKNVLTNKAKNNFQNYEKYTYQCYVKTLLDIKLSSEANAQDSSVVNKNKRIKAQAAFISEYVISCLKTGSWTESKIIAHKTSGLEDPMLVQSFTSLFHNSISFYNNSISLFELPFSNDNSITEYISPLSDGCIKIYNFHLQDTIVNTADSVFVINFYPKKGKNFNSLKGKLYISNNGYAIKNIVVEPVEQGLIGFKFRQDYEFINNKWFPSKLDEEIGWVKQKIRNNINAYPVYLITSNIDSVNYNPVISKSSNKLEKVYVDLYPNRESDSIINAIRPDSLTLREKNTFRVMDSVGRKMNLDYKLKLFPKLANGKIPVSCFDIDFYKIYGYNKFEGNRLGIGLYTNEKLSKHFSIGGFTGYGFKDEKYKHGGQMIFDLYKTNELQFKISYQNNLKEVGFDLIDDYSKLSFGDYLRSYIGFRFDRCIEKKAEISFRTLRFLKVSTSLSLKKINPTYSYLYKGSTLSNYQADELQVNVKYAYGLDLATWGNQRIVNYEGNPIINFTYKRGLNLFDKQSYQYNRIETTIDFTAYNGRIGQSYFRLATGFIDQSLPYGLLFTGEGSKDTDMPLLINNSFQTMSPNEFLSDKYVNLFYSHNFGSLLFTTRKFKPQFVVVQNSGWGTLNNATYQGINFKQKDKIYLESGLIINNIIRLNYINMFYFGFGVGGFYRYGYYGYDNYKDNFAFKLSITVSIK